jgi:predicted amidophosphoribosyltransferase
MAVAICKSEKCNFISRDGHEKFCPLCGGPTISECPDCHTELESLDQKLCSKCGTRLKDEHQNYFEEFNRSLRIYP